MKTNSGYKIGEFEKAYLFDALCKFNQIGLAIKHMKELKEKLSFYRENDEEDKSIEILGWELHAIDDATKFLGELTAIEATEVARVFDMNAPY